MICSNDVSQHFGVFGDHNTLTLQNRPPILLPHGWDPPSRCRCKPVGHQQQTAWQRMGKEGSTKPAAAKTPSPKDPEKQKPGNSQAAAAEKQDRGGGEQQQDAAVAMQEDNRGHGEERNSRDQGTPEAGEQATAAVLTMLAQTSKQQQAAADAGAGAGGAAAAKRTSASNVEESGRPTKLARNSSTASQQQQQTEGTTDSGGGGGDGGAPPDSPTGSDAVAAAASLHKLSSASAAEIEGSLAAYRAAVAATERTNAAAAAAAAAGGGGGGGGDRGLVSAADAQLLLGGLRRIGSGMSNVPLGSGGPLKPGQSKNGPHEIMQSLVESGMLQSYTPESHCYVKCGNVQGVFSLASGSILCLCNDCSGSDPCWFAPAAFERHGGMAASKKWRGSIQVWGMIG